MSKIGKGLAILLGVTTIAAGGMAGGMYVGENNYRNKTIEMEAQDKTELEEMAEQLEAMSLILDEKEEEITSLRSTKTSLETDKANLQAEVSEKQTAIVGLNATIAELEAQGEADSTAIATLTSQKTALEAEVATKQETITGLNSQITTLEGTISSKQDQLDGLSSQLSTLQSTHAELQTQYTVLQSSDSAKQEQINTLTGQIAVLQAQIIEFEQAAGGETVDQDILFLGKVMDASLHNKLKFYGVYSYLWPSSTISLDKSTGGGSGVFTLDDEPGTWYYDGPRSGEFIQLSSTKKIVPTIFTEEGMYVAIDSLTQEINIVDMGSSIPMYTFTLPSDMISVSNIKKCGEGGFLVIGENNLNEQVVKVINKATGVASSVQNANASIQVVHHTSYDNIIDYLYSVDEDVNGAYRFYNLDGTQIIAIGKNNTIVASVVNEEKTFFVYAQNGDETNLVYYSPNMQTPLPVASHDNIYFANGNIVLSNDTTGEFYDIHGNTLFDIPGCTPIVSVHEVGDFYFFSIIANDKIYFSNGDGVLSGEISISQNDYDSYSFDGLKDSWGNDVQIWDFLDYFENLKNETLSLAETYMYDAMISYFSENEDVLSEQMYSLEDGSLISPQPIVVTFSKNGVAKDPIYLFYNGTQFTSFDSKNYEHGGGMLVI